jgi:hypothetical protein
MTYLLFLLIAVAAIWLAVWQAKLRAQAEHRVELERDVIRAAMLRAGRITAIDVKTRLPNAVDEIEECLRTMHRQGYCESEVTEDGRHVYIFGAFDDAPQRALALEKNILRLAQIQNGVVRVPAVALSTDLSYLEARRVLEEMAAHGICTAAEEPDTFYFVGHPGARPEGAVPGGEEPPGDRASRRGPRRLERS